MNQVFTKKKLAAALTLAFATGGAAVLAVAPVPGLVAAAQANQFADTTQTAATTAGVNVPVTAAGTPVTVPGQTFVVTESTGGAIANGGVIVIKPSAGKIGVGTVAFDGTGLALRYWSGVVVDGVAAATSADIETDGSMKLVVIGSSTVGAAGQSFGFNTIKLDTNGVATGTPVKLSLSSSSTATGITTGVETTVANVVAKGATIASTATTTKKVAAGGTLTMDTAKVTEAVLGTFANNTTLGYDVVVELNGGYTWATKPTMSGDTGGNDPSNGAGAVTNGTGTGNSTTKAVYAFETNYAPSTAAAYVQFANGTVFIPAGTANGAITAKVTVYNGNAVLTSSDVTIGEVVSSGTTAAFVEASGTTATVDYNTLFAGRDYAAGITGGVGGENDQLKVTELVPSSLLVNGTVSLTLSGGAKFGAAPAKVDTTIAMTAATATYPAATQNYTVNTGSGTTAGANSVFTFGNLNLTSATAGDLSVTVGGNGGASAGTVKIASVVNATTATVAAGGQTVAANQVMTVPEITLVEGAYSALANNDTIGVALPAGYTIQTAAGDAAVSATALKNGTDVTVKVTDKNGTDVTATALGSATGNFEVAKGLSANGANQMFIVMAAAGQSGAANGPYTIKITGLKAKAASGAVAGDVNVTIAGAHSGGTSTAAALKGEEASSWTSKASATKQSVKVGSIVSNTVPAITAATTGANTSQTITGSVVAAANDQSKLGMIYVAAEVPSTGVFLKNSAGSWVAYNPAAPVAYAGPVTLGTTSVEVTKDLNVSGIIGTKIYLGYGLGTTAFGVTVPWNNMLTASTYNLVYTIQ